MKNKEKAHNLTEKPRTDDVIIHENINFNDLLLSKETLSGLKECGFIKPSPIQRKAIPLGKCGFDLIVQAKSGTGKTCVFTVIALEMLEPSLEKLQVLILTPTREIAVQIRDVISSIGKGLPQLKVEAFIGGLPLESDKKKLQKCQIAVGAPGRVKHLIKDGLMTLDTVRLFVLDEADKLVEDNFRLDVSCIYVNLPEIKQTIAVSATFPPELEEFVTRFMSNPMKVSPGKETFLLGIRQFISIVPSHLSVFVQMKNKLTELHRILSNVSFKQCLIFSNYQSRAESICNELNKEGWPSVYISGSQNQAARLKAVSSLKEFRCRVLLSTDLTSRGIDAEKVDLIINLDLPYDGATYMHRIGRAGRYGTCGLAITIVQSGAEFNRFRQMISEIGCSDSQMRLFPKGPLEFDIWEAKYEDFEKISSVVEDHISLETPNSEVVEKPKNGAEMDEEIKSKALTKLFSSSLTLEENPKIIDYVDLIRCCSKFEGHSDFETDKRQNDFQYKSYSTELKFSVIYLEKEGWKRHRKKITQDGELNKGENEIKPESNVLLDGNIGEWISVEVVPLKEKNGELRDYCEYLGDNGGIEDCVNVDVSDDCGVEEEDDSDDVSDGTDLREVMSDDESQDYDDSTLAHPIRDSLYIQQWYSMWHSQLWTIRQYTNYMKHFYYLNEMQNYR